MKTKLLFWNAVIFLILGLNAGDGTLFFFFSIHCFMLFIGISIHNLASKFQSRNNAEPLPQASPARK